MGEASSPRTAGLHPPGCRLSPPTLASPAQGALTGGPRGIKGTLG